MGTVESIGDEQQSSKEGKERWTTAEPSGRAAVPTPLGRRRAAGGRRRRHRRRVRVRAGGEGRKEKNMQPVLLAQQIQVVGGEICWANKFRQSSRQPVGMSFLTSTTQIQDKQWVQIVCWRYSNKNKLVPTGKMPLLFSTCLLFLSLTLSSTSVRVSPRATMETVEDQVCASLLIRTGPDRYLALVVCRASSVSQWLNKLGLGSLYQRTRRLAWLSSLASLSQLI